jgi:hypothetical protein
MINRDQAIEIARNSAAEQGWGLQEPLQVTERRRWRGGVDSYDIVTNPAMRGTSARFVIDATTGEIRSKGYIPR